MKAPTQRQVEGDLERIAELVPRLREMARWAWPMAYDTMHSHSPAAPVGSPGGGRPVEAAVAGVVRHEVAAAGELVSRAERALELAVGSLERAEALADEGRGGPTSNGPPMIDRTELAKAREALARRRERGEGYGES